MEVMAAAEFAFAENGMVFMKNGEIVETMSIS
jgi:hypothetical protein